VAQVAQVALVVQRGAAMILPLVRKICVLDQRSGLSQARHPLHQQRLLDLSLKEAQTTSSTDTSSRMSSIRQE
jgi:hypothetical protein